MLQYRLHFIRNQNADLGFLNLLQIHEGLRLTVISSEHLFLVKGCLILEYVRSVQNHCPSDFQPRNLAIYLNFFSSNKVGKGCHEKKQTRCLNSCFHHYNLLKLLHMTQIGHKNKKFKYFLVTLLNPCWSAFITLPFKWSNILKPYQIPLNIFKRSLSIDPYSQYSSYQH